MMLFILLIGFQVTTAMMFVWNHCDLFKIDAPDKLKAKQEGKAVNQAVKLLENGDSVS